MNGRGYSPQGYRPEPTTAPTTGSPIASPEHAGTDACAAVGIQLDVLYAFLKNRAAETPVVDPLFHEAVGYARGYADACLNNGDTGGALRKLAWMRNEAQRWDTHPDFPGEARQ
ncbi:hypothetical protein ACWCQL_10540 [Streptomyces sp. NPDC002073]